MGAGGGGWGVYHICGKSGGEGGYRFLGKMENPGRWGVLSELPSMVGVWIFFGTTHCKLIVFNLFLYIISIVSRLLSVKDRTTLCGIIIPVKHFIQ